MNQRKVWSWRGGNVRLLALVISIALHLVMLAVFGIARFSKCEMLTPQQKTPTVNVVEIRKFLQVAPVVPKPKIKRPIASRLAAKQDEILPADEIFEDAKPYFSNKNVLKEMAESQSEFSLADDVMCFGGVDFFGSSTSCHKICYVVDCSGSMQGLMGCVRKELKKSISELQPDNYFGIIFFGNGKLFEFGGGRLLRATPKSKSAAYDFIDTIKPSGKTNAVAAIERATQIRDACGDSPQAIYFLTDGFELTSDGMRQFSDRITNLLKSVTPETNINTIGFESQGNDCELLEILASQTGGKFISVSGGDY